MTLTKEEAIRRHRMMWERIGNETLKAKRCIGKEEVFDYFGWNIYEAACACWCCEYTGITCTRCPIKWPGVEGEYSSCTIMAIGKNDRACGIFARWLDSCYKKDWRTAAYYALYISMLPERK